LLAARLGALLARAVALAGDARAREAAMLAAMDARLGDRFRAEMQASPPPPSLLLPLPMSLLYTPASARRCRRALAPPRRAPPTRRRRPAAASLCKRCVL
jgi:hypothetical protein